MKFAIASDHAGFKMKEAVKAYLISQKYGVVDFGTDSEESVDYPDFGKLAAKDVSGKKADYGLLVCGSGIGMCMAANRFKGVRAAVINNEFDAEMSRRHNNANIACFGSRKLSNEQAIKLLDLWIKTPFEGGRHEKRIEKMDKL
ncbi:MAG: ribose 5-phosphate isomerase B [Deltaproteobacteria bacterium]|nr:ribose 5-phosphate isomerase B [Deltaproteobacteria bacterium]